MSEDASIEKPARKIGFNNRVAVVLIPQRKEIKAAGCDLWWTRSDYTAFQQSAHSEIRLYAMYENIDCKEAKNMLYQPSEADQAKSDAEAVELDSGEWELTMPGPNETEDAEESDQEESFSPILLRHVDSVSLLTNYDEKADAPKTPERSKSSQSALGTPGKASSASLSEEDHSFLSVCVPAKSFELLTEAGSKPGRGRNASRIDQSSGFAVVCGIFSFTLPIIGYYLMHYSQ